MTTTIVYVHVLPEYINAFISATVKNHELSVKEPGNLRFDVLQQEGEPGEFVLYEGYEDEKAATAHKQTPHYLEWRETVAVMMAAPREGVKYTGLKP